MTSPPKPPLQGAPATTQSTPAVREAPHRPQKIYGGLLLLVPVLIVVLLGGCASFRTTDPAALAHLPRTAAVAGVPFYPQQEKYCGPAALATALDWTGASVTQDGIARQVFTPGADGSYRHDLIAAARRHGRLAVPVRNLATLLREVAAGTPAIVFQNLGLNWWPRWHFAVLTGYDLDKANVILNSGDEQNRVMGLALFERTWRRGDSWALLVLSPDRLPVTASVYDVMTAAAGLERAGRLDAAATAYAATTRRWPDHWLAFLGLGNVRYRQGDAAAAEAAYRAALRLNPEAAEAWNNLAYALKRQGRTAEALAAARAAVAREAAPGHVRTLREMQDALESR